MIREIVRQAWRDNPVLVVLSVPAAIAVVEGARWLVILAWSIWG